MSTELLNLTAGEASKMLAAKKVSPVELLDAFLGRIEAVDEKIHSYILVTAEQAREHAQTAEKEILAGDYKGLLHGIPYAVKDNYFTKGIRTCVASRVLMDHVPDFDSTVISKLDQAGAVMLGKLNTWEYGTGTGSVHFDLPFEPARNPWNTDYITGGSSSGSGASVAGRTAMVSMGSDTGGSVRLPAAACGLQGLKPTYGRISKYGILPNCWSLDVAGPLCWTVEDCAIMLQAVAGYDPRDSASLDVAVPDYMAELGKGVKGLKIAYVSDLDSSNDLLDVANRLAFENMIQVLRSEGAELVEVKLPTSLSDYRDANGIIGQVESYSLHEKEYLQSAHLMGQALRDKLTSGFMYRAVDYVNAQRRRKALAMATDELIQNYDALIMPCALHTAPKYGNDAHVKAFTTDTACPVFNISGHPAMSICTGFDANGLPTNAQIVGKWLDEAMVLRVGHAFERATDFRKTRPAL